MNKHLFSYKGAASQLLAAIEEEIKQQELEKMRDPNLWAVKLDFGECFVKVEFSRN